jgi:hypothetical protein
MKTNVLQNATIHDGKCNQAVGEYCNLAIKRSFINLSGDEYVVNI